MKKFKTSDMMSKLSTVLTIFVLAATIMFVSDSSAFASYNSERNSSRHKEHHSITIVNRIGYPINAIMARPTGGYDDEEVIAFVGTIEPGDSDAASFDYDYRVRAFDIRVLYGDEGKGYYYMKVRPDSIRKMILNYDGTVDYVYR